MGCLQIHVGSCVWLSCGKSKAPIAVQVDEVFTGGRPVSHKLMSGHRILDISPRDVGSVKEVFISTRKTCRPLVQVLGPCNALCSHKAGHELIDHEALAAANFHYGRYWCHTTCQAKPMEDDPTLHFTLACALEFLKKRQADPSLAQQAFYEDMKRVKPKWKPAAGPSYGQQFAALRKAPLVKKDDKDYQGVAGVPEEALEPAPRVGGKMEVEGTAAKRGRGDALQPAAQGDADATEGNKETKARKLAEGEGGQGQ